MPLEVIGAGLGRTGTLSLKVALERLLGAPCYHMAEVLGHPEHVPLWRKATRGELEDWESIFSGYAAAVDWPAAAFWRELARAWPDAPVVLSVRDPEDWWESADATIFPSLRSDPPPAPPFVRDWHAMVCELLDRRFGASVDDREGAIAAFERHNACVRAEIPPERLVEWRPDDGWAPLCAALGLPVPEEPFPRRNTREEFIARAGSGRSGV